MPIYRFQPGQRERYPEMLAVLSKEQLDSGGDVYVRSYHLIPLAVVRTVAPREDIVHRLIGMGASVVVNPEMKGGGA